MCYPITISAPAIRRSCRWIHSDPIGLMAAGARAPLAVIVDGVVETFWVSPIEDGVWECWQPLPDGDAFVHLVEESVVGGWSCETAAELADALPAALRHIGF